MMSAITLRILTMWHYCILTHLLLPGQVTGAPPHANTTLMSKTTSNEVNYGLASSVMQEGWVKGVRRG